MKKTKMEKGITLIALIITIVVLLILAAVAIAAIQNENILSHANNAAVKYNQAVKNEQDILGGYLNLLNNNGGGDPDLAWLEKYILGEAKTGRALTDILDMGTMSFLDDEATTDVDESTLVISSLTISADRIKLYIYTKYNSKIYKMVADGATMSMESINLVYKPEGREGDPVRYDSNGDGNLEDWIIITDRNGLVEIVSTETKGSLSLGMDDTTVTVTTDIDDDGEIGDNHDIAIISYNNAITTINNYCKEVMNMENVRSVGGTDNTIIPYSSPLFDEKCSEITVDVASGDMQYELDFIKLLYHGKLDTGSDYWFASRSVSEWSAPCFYVRYYNEGSEEIYDVDLYQGSGVAHPDKTFGVRPVVINPAGI